MNSIKSVILASVISSVLLGCESAKSTNTQGEKPSAATPDTIAPVITLSGSSSLSIFQDSIYQDAGATANDNIDGNITDKVTTKNLVNTSIIGGYKVTYDVSDVAGNKAKQLARTVNVVAIPNVAPSIIGSPKTTTNIYDTYQFLPVASDDNKNDTLTFSIENKPEWAAFNATTGLLQGVVPAGSEESYNDIIISVSDSEETVALPAFSITVSSAENIAHKLGKATQGSMYGSSEASYAIDGDSSTFNHTGCNATGNWWQLELPSFTALAKIVVQNRPSWHSRLAGTKIYLGTSAYNGTLIEENLIGTLSASGSAQVFDYDLKKEGKYLLLKAASNNCLHTAEVEVYGKTSATPVFKTHKDEYLIKSTTAKNTIIANIPAIDYQSDILSYSIVGTVPFTIDAKGNITVKGELDLPSYALEIQASDGVNSASTNITINVTPLNAIEKVLASGDVINTPVTEEELIQATLDEIDASKILIQKAKAKIFNLNANGTAKSDGTSLTNITWNPTHDASLFRSTLGVNTPLLHTNAVYVDGYTVYKKEISIIGEKGKGRYMMMGGNPLRVEGNDQMNQMMENGFAWLSGRDDLKTTPFKAVIAHLDESHWFRDESKTRAWLDSHYAGQVSYNTANACDGTALASCLADAPDVLIISQVSTQDNDVNAIASIVDQALKEGVSVLYIHHDGNYKALGKALFTTVFDIDYHWDNYWFRLRVDGFDPTTSFQAEELVAVKTLFTHLKNEDYAFDWTQCINSKGEKSSSYGNCSNVTTLNSDFEKGANSVKRLLDSLDYNKKAIFESQHYRLQKLLLLTADKMRQSVTYPMDKVTTDDNDFMRSFYADHAVYNFRKINPVQPDMGNFSRSDFSHITPITKIVNLTSKKHFRSAGVYALPGQTVNITRNDNSDLTVKVFINTLRSGATHQYEKQTKSNQGYNRPKYLQTPRFEIKSGETIELTSPYGGPLQLEFSTNDLPVEIKFENVGEHAYWASSADNDSFAQKLDANEYEWAEVATAGFEVHSKLDKMIQSVANEKWGGTAEGLANAVNKYTSNYPHVLAGFKGEGVDVVPEIHDWANQKGLTIETIDTMKHMNADQATCGYGCSGNPYDAYWAFDPIGHGDIHELGHSLQKMRFEGFPNHAATNTFSFYTKSKYTANTGDTGNSCGGLPFKTIYQTIQSSVGNADVEAYLKTNLWDTAGLGEQYLLKIQAMMHAQKMGKVENGWHVLARVHVLEREMRRAKQDWDAKKASVGFDQYSLDEINAIRNNDWLIVAYSYAAGLDYINYFDMMGIPYSQKARDQITSFGFEVVPDALFESEDTAYCSSENLMNQPLINVDGTTVWSTNE